MARSFNGSNQYGSIALTQGVPLTLAIWGNFVSVSGIQELIGCSNGANQHMRIVADGSNIKAQTFDGGTNASAPAALPATSIWIHWAATFPDASHRTLFKNGVQAATDSTATSTFSGDTAEVGAQVTSSFAFPFNGQLAEAAIWSATLTATELLALAAGCSPKKIRPGSLVCYWALWGLHSPEIDLSGNVGNLTLTNGPTSANHAPVTLFTGKSRTYPTLVTSTTFTQAITATANSISTVKKSVGKIQTFTDSTISSLVKSVGLVRSFICSTTNTMKRVANLSKSFTGNSTSSLIRTPGKTQSITTLSTSILLKRTGKTETINTSSINTLGRISSKLQSLAIVATVSLLKGISKVVSTVSSLSTSTVTRTTGKQETATSSSITSMLRTTGHVLSLPVLSISVLSKRTGKILTKVINSLSSLLNVLVGIAASYRKVTVYGRNDTNPLVTGEDTTHKTTYGRNDTLQTTEGE